MFNYAKAFWIEILTETFVPTAAVAVGRFVDDAGNQVAAAGVRARGVARTWLNTADVALNKTVTVITLGLATIETGGNVAVKDVLTSDNQGRAITRGVGQVGNAIALEACTTGAGGQILALVIQEVAPVASAAIADTAGATLGQLETTVNAIKAVLRAQGLLAP